MTDLDRLKSLVESEVERAGVELVDVELAGSKGRPLIRVYVDTDTGITLDRCAQVSRTLEPVLEGARLVPERYVLEVSSPGINRPLTRRRHFERFVGREIEVRVREPRDGRQRFVGVLEHVAEREGDGFEIRVRDPRSEEDPWSFVAGEIAKARLHVNWDSIKKPAKGR